MRERATGFLAEGERKHATILFADVAGSLELADGRDPEEVGALLDPAIGRMMEAVHRYHGIVNQVLGDGIMAIFDAPGAARDHALAACLAALRMQDRIAGLGPASAAAPPVRIRVGLNSGEVLIRTIANGADGDCSAVGRATHLAARMQQMARPGSTLVGGETARLVQGRLQFEPMGPLRVKGLTEPVEVYELVRLGAPPSEASVPAGRR
ncbi:MAG: adenylate/guanylate cyclase domain-containing protein [Candidatus Rokubacteria bacterium]|nr:adenylate/guanylate cyclase domain-containing protein [Candidatus Rokubacteria bacterium]